MQAQLPQQREEQKRQKGVPRAEKGVTERVELTLDVMAAGAATAPRVGIAQDW